MARERRRVSVLGLVFVALGVAILVSLGVWQLQRRVWKETLLARIEALKDSPPEPLNVVFNRVRDGGELDFVRVAARCEGLGEGAAHLFAMRPDGSPGWRQIGACRLSGSPYGAILVDLGFETLPVAPGAIPEPAAQPVTLPAGVAVTGVLRAPEPKAWWSGLVSRTSAAQGAGGTDGARFLARDIPAMAVALGAARPAPVMLSLETPLAGPTLQPAPLPTDIPNRHLEYALTWFGLAAALVVFTLVRLFARRGPGRA